MTTNRTDDSRSRTDRKASWLSLGFEDLVRSIGTSDAKHPARGSAANPFDVLIVGSGYGGAVAASELAGATHAGAAISVCVLERGKEYLPGMFPGASDELGSHIRFNTPRSPRPAGTADGLFDLRIGPDVNVVVANGLGGGSLINAGVMLEPSKEVLGDKNFRGLDFKQAAALLSPTPYPRGKEPKKADRLHDLKPNRYDTVPITVGPPERVLPGSIQNSANVKVEHCKECGDCATGCNFGAKNSLDLNLLVKAAHNGAEIYSGGCVLRIERENCRDHGWIAHAVPTDLGLRRRHGEPLQVHARRLILAAGTLGSTEILLRSRTDKLRFSDMLGRHFSTNGDMLAVVHGQKKEANAIADEETQPGDRNVGPTITSMLDLRGDPSKVAVQELTVPGPLRRLFEEVFTTAFTLDQLGEGDEEKHSCEDDFTDPCAVDPSAMKRTTIVAMMGDDGAEGALELVGDATEPCGDGAVVVRWPKLRGGAGDNPNDSLFDGQMRILEDLVSSSGTGGRVLANPVWRLLPKKLSFLMDEARGPVLTVHPLGGCSMGLTRAEGVVNRMGQVFDASQPTAQRVFHDLIVLDGSIVPRALGINPALTITALALRAVRALRRRWNLSITPTDLPHRVRPVFDDKEYGPKPASEVSIIERLVGKALVALPNQSAPRRMIVELTVRYKPESLRKFMGKLKRTVDVDEDKSFLRVFEEDAYREANRPQPPHGADLTEAMLDDASILRWPLGGKLHFFQRECSTPCERRRRALWGWLWNRGGRDTWDALRNYLREKGKKIGSSDSIRERAEGVWALASRAGEARLFQYELKARGDGRVWEIEGYKRLTYEFRCNLWEQLETLNLTRFMDRPACGKLAVDLTYFSAHSTPLLRIESQHDLITTMVDIVSFVAMIMRIMVNVHVWSFRRPDDQRPRVPQRLPGDIARPWLLELIKFRTPLPRPRIYEIIVDHEPDGTPVVARLTRYARFDARACAKRPVLLIHGYSASGTTFAHTAIKPNLAEQLWHSGRDVWIADLRTSAGMPTATEPWSFEDAALMDIPASIDFILRESKSMKRRDDKIDVVAHCMGAAMLSMAILKKPERGDPLFDVRAALHKRLGCVILSQVGPLVQFTPINVLRADVMKYIRRFISGPTYDFRVKDSPTVTEQLVDRFFSSLRYPRRERPLESPLRPWARTEFVGTRHRIDALYGRAFSLANMGREVLDNIDDFFGPLSLETVSQGMHLAKETVITDRSGRNVYVTRKARDERWIFPTLTLHGADNGMVDVMTRYRIDNYFNCSDRSGARLPRARIEQQVFLDTGHQDSFIGKRATTGAVFASIVEFLDRPRLDEDETIVGSSSWLIAPPWIGPNRGVTPPGKKTLTLAAATTRIYGDAAFAVCVAVKRVQDIHKKWYWEPVKIPTLYGLDSSTYLFNAPCDREGWLAVEVTPNLVDAPSPAEGFLFLLVYDQPSRMTEDQVKQLAQLRQTLDEVTAKYAVPADLEVFMQAKKARAAMAAAKTGGAAGPVPPLTWAELERLHDNMVALKINDDIKMLVDKLLKMHTADHYDPAFIDTRRPSTVQPGFEAQIFVSSCQFPQGLLDELPAWKSYKHLGEKVVQRLDIPRERKMLLLVGDQIYSDATAGFADPTLPDERYRRPHEFLLSRADVKKVLREVPTAMMLDDHEIYDNWEPSRDSPRPRLESKPGIDAYKDFQRRAGPKPFHVPCHEAPDPLWFTHCIGDVNVFVADTRSERRVREAKTYDEARIMSGGQHEALLKWLRDLHGDKSTADAPKFIASPSMLLPRKIANHMESLPVAGQPTRTSMASTLRYDSWQGYPWSVGSLLHCIASEGIRNVIFLSGDEHLFCNARAVITPVNGGDATVIHSIHCSPLYAPLRFVNSAAAYFPAKDDFRFSAPDPGRTAYDCDVTAEVLRTIHNGFTEILVKKDGTSWSVEAIFHDNHGNNTVHRKII